MDKEKLHRYFTQNDHWDKELQNLREIVLSTDLEETIKWGMPTYTYNKKNVVGIGVFKNHYGLWFFQGGLLKDEKKVLRNAQEGKTKAMRQMKFDKKEKPKKGIIKAYIKEAITNVKEGKSIKPTRKSTKFEMAPVLGAALKSDKALNRCYAELTLARQREYSDYINEAKRESTKQSRLQKIIPIIKEGKPLSTLWTF